VSLAVLVPLKFCVALDVSLQLLLADWLCVYTKLDRLKLALAMLPISDMDL
jgi:hypothetical protein